MTPSTFDALQKLEQCSKSFQEQLQQKEDLASGLQSQLALVQESFKVGADPCNSSHVVAVSCGQMTAMYSKA